MTKKAKKAVKPALDLSFRVTLPASSDGAMATTPNAGLIRYSGNLRQWVWDPEASNFYDARDCRLMAKQLAELNKAKPNGA